MRTIKMENHYALPEERRNGNVMMDVVHSALSQTFRQIAEEYLLRIGQENREDVPELITVWVTEQPQGLQIRVEIDEVKWQRPR